MPGAFRMHSVEALMRRREYVEQEIASLANFRDKIDRRIASLRSKELAKVHTPIPGERE